VLTVGATCLLTFIAFIVFRSPGPVVPTEYQGVWITLPLVEEDPADIARAQTGQEVLEEQRGSEARRSAVRERAPEVANTHSFSTEPASAPEVGGRMANALEDKSGQPYESLGARSKSTAPRSVQIPSTSVTAIKSARFGGPIYAINLESTVTPIDSSTVKMLPVIGAGRLYVTRFEKDSRIWHRLRLGFFENEQNARQVLAPLRSDYPDAWVTRITPEEALASAGTAIHEPTPSANTPVLLVALPPDSPSELPERSPSDFDHTASSTSGFAVVDEIGNAREIGHGTISDSPTPWAQAADSSVGNSPGKTSDNSWVEGNLYRPSSTERALLKRWSQSTVASQPGGNNRDVDGRVGLVGYSIGFEGETERPGSDRPLNNADEWQQSFAFRGDLSFSRLAKLQFRNELIEQRDEQTEYIGDFLIGRNSDQWRQNRINSSTLDIGFFDNRLTSKTVLNSSRYTSSDLDDKYTVGYQLLQALNLQILRGENTRLSIFGTYGEVDQNYNDFALDEDDKTKKNPFSEPGQAGFKFGGTLGLGPADLTLAQTDSWDDGSQTRTYEATLGLDLNRLRPLSSGLLGETFWKVAPDFVSLSYGVGTVDVGTGIANRTRDVSASANWAWDSGYTYLGYWSSYYDNRQPGNEDYDWTGEGLDLGGGLWGNRWNVDGWLSLSRSYQMGEWSEAQDLSLGGGLSLSVRPISLPDLKVSLSSDHYKGDYTANDGLSHRSSWIFTSELDFTKYFAEAWGPRTSKFGMVFQVRNDSDFEKWGGSGVRDSDAEYFVGLRMGIGLGEDGPRSH